MSNSPPQPPADASEREKQLWKELINRMVVMEATQPQKES